MSQPEPDIDALEDRIRELEAQIEEGGTREELMRARIEELEAELERSRLLEAASPDEP